MATQGTCEAASLPLRDGPPSQSSLMSRWGRRLCLGVTSRGVPLWRWGLYLAHKSDVGRSGANLHGILLVVQQRNHLVAQVWEGMHRRHVGSRHWPSMGNFGSFYQPTSSQPTRIHCPLRSVLWRDVPLFGPTDGGTQGTKLRDFRSTNEQSNGYHISTT